MKQSTQKTIENIMIILGLFTIILFIYQIAFDLTYEQDMAIIIIDTVICGLFWIELFAFTFLSKSRKVYVKSRIPDMIGMIPMPGLSLVKFRFVRFLRLLRLLRLEAIAIRLARFWRVFRTIRPARRIKKELK